MDRDENESLGKNEKNSASESSEESSSDEFENSHEVVDESYLDRVEVKVLLEEHANTVLALYLVFS